ncbi:MAG TPA: sterol desaturase family protein [Polyangia bacterium]
MLNYIALAVPFFFVLIGGELLLARRRGVALYRFGDAITDLSCGVMQQVALVFYAAFLLGVYVRLYDGHRLFTFTSKGWPWVIAFAAVDFLYYWWHRASHRVNVLWAAHVVHHQSEDYNLAVALRQAILTSWTGMPFYLPLALLGVPPLVYATTQAFSTLYQFWIHTRLVGPVGGPLGWILNLPAHHRVHHAVNPRYLDRNFGATLIVWDRLFGTYADETEPPVYGITHPLGSYNPLWAQTHYLVELGRTAWAAPRLADKLRLWLMPPGWVPAGLPRRPHRPGAAPNDPQVSGGVKLYVAANFAAVVVVATVLMLLQERLPLLPRAGLALLVFGALVTLGGLLERKPWARRAEALRLALSAAAALALAVLR